MGHSSIVLAIRVLLAGLAISSSALGSNTSRFPYVQQCEQLNTTHCIYIDLMNGTNNASCLQSNSPIFPCKDLNFAFAESARSDYTAYILSNDVHTLYSPIAPFINLNNITFIGAGMHETVIRCQSNDSGLSFEDVSNLSLINLSVSNCSALRNSSSMSDTPHQTRQIMVALYFYRCVNVSFDKVSVHNSPEATGVVVYDTTGTNVILNSEFAYNSVSSDNPGGGGFYVEFTFCVPGSKNCSNNPVTHNDRNSNSKYIFQNCTFKNNTAKSILAETTYLVPYRSNHIALGRGGGLSIFMKGNASNNTIVIKNCTFENNSATWGAGLFVEFHDETSRNTVSVLKCNMTYNLCPFTASSGTAGGGMRLGHYVFGKGNHLDKLDSVSNQISISGCNFSNNAALNGGGLSISPTVQNVETYILAKISVSATIFENNYARLGAALHINRFAMILDGNILQVTLSQCLFLSNSVDYIKYLHHSKGIRTFAYQPGLGAVYINQVPVVFERSVRFERNNGTALAAVGSSLDFSTCSALFSNNQGTNGGAIYLLGLAWIRIDSETSMLFQNNVATLDGGAIHNRYIERENLISYGNCFIRHTDYGIGPEQWGASFYFNNNSDLSGKRTSSIFSTSIVPCAWAGGSLINQDLKKVFCWNSNWHYSPGNCSSHIHSHVGKVKFSHTSNSVEAFPGHHFKIPMQLYDDLNHNLGYQNVFSASLSQHNNYSLFQQYIWQQETEIRGNVGSRQRLLLDGISDHAWHIVVKVKLKECPPGFHFDSLKQECTCLTGTYSGAISCNKNYSSAYLNNNTWMGKIDGYDDYVVGLCPSRYCYANEQSSLPNTSSGLEEVICAHYNRNGTLCGNCMEGYAVAVNSPFYQCVNCTGENMALNTLKYVAAVYVPLTFLFSLIIIFNVQLTSAPANAFILFSQLVSSTFDLYADGQISYSSITGNEYTDQFVQAYRFVYGIFNLEFIEQYLDPFCIGNLTALGVISLDYLVASFPLLMIILILVIHKVFSLLRNCCCPGIRRAIRSPTKWNMSKALIPAFAAFFLLSYNKFSQTSSFLVGSESLTTSTGDSVPMHYDGLRVYYAGFYSFYDLEYRKYYLLPACIIFATFVAIPPILLLDFPVRVFERCLSKIEYLWRKYPVDKVHILLDTFQGCYKNNMRIFAGLYFLFRLAINTIYNLTNDWFLQYLLQQIACLVMVGLLVICQPYNKENKIFNIIDPLFLLNLAALNVLSFFLLSKFSDQQDAASAKPYLILQCVLVLAPLVYIVSYIAQYLIKKHSKWLTSKLKLRNGETIRSLQGIVTTQYVEVSNEEYYDDEEEALLRRAQLKNTYRTHTRTVVRVDGQDNDNNEEIDSGLRSAQTSSTKYGSTKNSTQSSGGVRNVQTS